MLRSLFWIFCVLLLVLQYRFLLGEGSVLDVMRLRKAIAAEQDVIAKLEKRNQLLERDVQALKGQPEALEDRARQELGMVKSGETFCIVIEPAR